MHRQGRGWRCGACGRSADAEPTVYFSIGSDVTYHSERRCLGFVGGQAKVERRGGEAAPVRTSTRAAAQREGKSPCEVCTPLAWRT